MGRKFGLAKFYFGLIRFVCDLLLVTAKLNNNNTEFVWVVGGLHTHNLVKPTLLVKVELGFDNNQTSFVLRLSLCKNITITMDLFSGSENLNKQQTT